MKNMVYELLNRILGNKLCMLWLTLSLLCLIYTGVVLSVRSGTFSFMIWIALSAIFAIFAYLAYGKNGNNLMPILRYMICAVSGIVTNSFHVFRGVRIAKKYTSDEVCGIAAYMQPLYMPNNMVRETFGIIRDFVNGNI